MALSVAILGICAGGGHVTVEITEDGAKPRTRIFERSELEAMLPDGEHDELVLKTIRYQLANKGASLEEFHGKDIIADAPGVKP